MKVKFAIEPHCALKQEKSDSLRDALLRLVNSGSSKKQDMILCARGCRTVRTCFLTQKQYKEYIDSINAQE